MAIASVKITLNGTTTNLTLNSPTGKWEGTVTAPSVTSFNIANQYYPVTVSATNDAGTTTTKTSTDSAIGSSLRLVVKEIIKPTITISSPSSGAYITNSQQRIEFTVTDESGGSGVKLSSVTLKVDSDTYTSTSTGMVTASITNGYSFTYTPQTALTEGSHTITINATDNDGNIAVTKSAVYTVDTVPPMLSLSSPTSNLITNKATCTVTGVTNDSTSSPVTLTILLNGTSQGTITVNSDGSFSKAVTLAEGSNTIKVTATDKSAQSTSISRTVKLDTTIPAITAITLTPNPANTSGSVAIVVTVS